MTNDQTTTPGAQAPRLSAEEELAAVREAVCAEPDETTLAALEFWMVEKRHVEREFNALLERAVKAEQALEQARTESARLRALINQEIMPRYVEMFEAAGLGDASQSVVVGMARDALAAAPADPAPPDDPWPPQHEYSLTFDPDAQRFGRIADDVAPDAGARPDRGAS
jgi:hypothetical protein